jgi:hypothetical protein
LELELLELELLELELLKFEFELELKRELDAEAVPERNSSPKGTSP